jgi:hypothetical protein
VSVAGRALAWPTAGRDVGGPNGWNLGSAALILRAVLTDFRARIARVLALCVFMVTFGRVQVNPSGKPTASGPGRVETPVAAKREAVHPQQADR